jgi:HSP20 family protein
MSTHFLEREFFPFDLLVKNFFDATNTFIPAIEAKINHPINIFEDDLGLTFELACTGISKDAIEIKLGGDMIQFNYDKEKTPEIQNRKYITRGIAKRSFNVGYKVGSKFDLSKAKANFADGLLTVSIPFATEAKPKLLKIN